MVYGPTQALAMLNARIAAANASLDGTVPKKTALFTLGEMLEIKNILVFLAKEAQRAPDHAGFVDFPRPMSVQLHDSTTDGL